MRKSDGGRNTVFTRESWEAPEGLRPGIKLGDQIYMESVKKREWGPQKKYLRERTEGTKRKKEMLADNEEERPQTKKT